MPNPQPKLPQTITGLDSDQDNADALVNYYGPYIRYTVDSQCWYAWQGDRWVPDTGALIVSSFWTRVARNIESTIPSNTTPKPNPHYRYSLSAKAMDSLLKLVRSNPKVQVTAGSFDSRAYELNTPQGIVDLNSGSLDKPRPTHMHTRQTNYTPAEGPSPLWTQFLKDTFQGDQQLIDYIQLVLGSALIGEVVEQKFYYAFGTQGTGKSTFFNVIYELLGDYAKYANCSLIVKGQSKHPEEIAKLQGKRLIFMAEPDANDTLDIAKLKWLTGGDQLEGRFMRKDSFDFRPSHSLFLYGNYLLNVANKSEGIYRRMSLLPFERTIWNAPTAVARYEDTLLNDEGPQILQWLIEGAQLYIDKGKRIDMPLHLKLLVKEYEDEQDIFGQYVYERLDTEDKDAAVSHKELWSDYSFWCEEIGLEKGQGKFGTKGVTQALLSGKYGQIRKTHTNKGTKFLGVKLRPQSTKTTADEWGRH